MYGIEDGWAPAGTTHNPSTLTLICPSPSPPDFLTLRASSLMMRSLQAVISAEEGIGMIDSAAAHSNRSVIPCGEEEGPAAVVAAVTASRALSSCTSVVRASESLPLSTWAYVAARDRGSPDGDDGQPGHRIWARGVGGMVTVGSGVVGRKM